MRITKDEGLRMALALDVAITCLEFEEGAIQAPKGITKSLKQDSLIHLRELRSAALRANRDAKSQAVGDLAKDADAYFDTFGGDEGAQPR